MLSSEQIAEFRDNGFLAVDRIASDDEVARLRDLYAEIVADPTGLTLTYQAEREDGTTGIITQVFSPEFKHPELLETEYIRNATRAVAAVLDVDESDITYGGLMLIYKPAGEGRDTPWHQDEAYWGERNAVRCNSASVWMPLDDVTVESGCMQYLPKTHEGDVLPHIKPDGPEPLHLDPPVDISSAVPCPIPAGGATIHHCRTIHYGGPNVSMVPRRAMTTIFHGPAPARDVPLEKPWLEGGRVWEDAR
jgi:ectoine hydroxylase-related dioxygenase (phytanoyl-CoA dioxygenase family)